MAGTKGRETSGTGIARNASARKKREQKEQRKKKKEEKKKRVEKEKQESGKPLFIDAKGAVDLLTADLTTIVQIVELRTLAIIVEEFGRKGRSFARIVGEPSRMVEGRRWKQRGVTRCDEA